MAVSSALLNGPAAAKAALKARAALSAAVPDVPHVPLDDDWYAYEDKFGIREGGYFDPMSKAVREDREGIMRAGGYVVNEAWERALRCAVASLDLMPLVDDDAATASATATAAAGVGVGPSLLPPNLSGGSIPTGDIVMAAAS